MYRVLQVLGKLLFGNNTLTLSNSNHPNTLRKLTSQEIEMNETTIFGVTIAGSGIELG